MLLNIKLFVKIPYHFNLVYNATILRESIWAIAWRSVTLQNIIFDDVRDLTRELLKLEFNM